MQPRNLVNFLVFVVVPRPTVEYCDWFAMKRDKTLVLV